MNLKDIKDFVRQNVTLKERLDELNALQTTVKKALKEGLQELGVETDRGHIVVEFDEAISGIKGIMHQRKVSKNLDIEVAEELLKEKGLHTRCIVQVPVLDEDEIMAAFYEGLITEEDIDKMFPSNVSYALIMMKG